MNWMGENLLKLIVFLRNDSMCDFILFDNSCGCVNNISICVKEYYIEIDNKEKIRKRKGLKRSLNGWFKGLCF